MGKKVYYEMFNLGKCKYVVNYHDGLKTHKDGSPFFDIHLTNNKKEHEKFIRTLVNDGYVKQF